MANFNGVQMEVERRFRKGLAFQAFWVLANTLTENGSVASSNSFLPGAVPADFDAANRFLNYRRDTTAPHQTIRWNWVAELPFGKGKRFLGSARGAADKLVGGWQVAGTGQWRTNYFALPTSIYPNGTPIQQYGYQYPVQDCRSGVCTPAYLFFNGYITPAQMNSHNASGPVHRRVRSAGRLQAGGRAHTPLGCDLRAQCAGGNQSAILLGHEHGMDPSDEWHGTANHLQRQPASMAKPVPERPQSMVSGCFGL